MTKTTKFICPLCREPGQRDGAKSRCVKCGKMADEMDASWAEMVKATSFPDPAVMRHWRLNELGEPIPCSIGEFGCFLAGGGKHVKKEWVGNVEVSTIFLGIDFGFGLNRTPVLWETMTFSNRKEFDQEQDRCGGNRDQAEAMHAAMVKRVKQAQGIK